MVKALAISSFVVFAFIAVSATPLGIAQAKKPMSSMQGGMSMREWELGSWSCRSHMSAMGRMPARTMNTTMTFRVNEMRRWIDLSSTENGRVGFMGHMSRRASNGVFTGIDDEGDLVTENLGSGWTGNMMTMTGTMWGPHGTGRVRDTVTRISDTHFRHDTYAYMNGSWKLMGSDDCTKM